MNNLSVSSVVSLSCLVSAVASAQLTITWDEVNDPRVQTYVVYYANTNDGLIKQIDVGNVTSYTFEDMLSGFMYIFCVKAAGTGISSEPILSECSDHVTSGFIVDSVVNADDSITAVFSEDMNAELINSDSFVLTDSDGVVVPATVSYDAVSRTAILTPIEVLKEYANYTARIAGVTDVAGNVLEPEFVWAFTTGSVRSCPCSIFSTAVFPEYESYIDNGSVELGIKFLPRVDGHILGIRFYKSPASSGAHVGNLWDAEGNLLNSTAFANETVVGWQEAYFAERIDVVAGKQYTASYFTRDGNYAVTLEQFAAAGMLTPYFEIPPSAGVFVYGPASGFPSATYDGNNYWVDVIFVPTDTASPFVMFASPYSPN